ncbi:hypothetical protein BCV72DRAFT_307805 [Rhizopus microsporus var. microsporus]|uniref:Uncharacterized protein n=2 Tax=Rhizopus microsporus TaxID=58291 RepID=A0A2G4SY09_RHIZD|nr:uncharacterized protein RHIMIDRAFT_236733 [Rhizopus microsporus ATCC 52813]ORE03924.1 hypothetical protein BCV72DRAFT_307805 [Rhizopus microsporus var. microsporus]PHZ13678.1 hypothetical protein RHIMIDRAFT_236733 [Rhizopus microsporus ATCC 52813]
MKRSITIDFHDTWGLCRYYYTHNTGSSDDILLTPSSLCSITTEMSLGYATIYSLRRYTYPTFTVPVPSNKSVKHEKSRRHSATESKVHTSNIKDSDTEDHQPSILIFPGNKRSSKYTPSPSSAEKVEAALRPSPEAESTDLIIEIPNTSPEQSYQQQQQQDEKRTKADFNFQLDIFLFLFGFLIFPCWWFGAWRYFLRPTHGQCGQIFQILNCCMSLVSLLIAGLLVGLAAALA